jgi:hypothetical protein
MKNQYSLDLRVGQFTEAQTDNVTYRKTQLITGIKYFLIASRNAKVGQVNEDMNITHNDSNKFHY